MNSRIRRSFSDLLLTVTSTHLISSLAYYVVYSPSARTNKKKNSTTARFAQGEMVWYHMERFKVIVRYVYAKHNTSYHTPVHRYPGQDNNPIVYS